MENSNKRGKSLSSVIDSIVKESLKTALQRNAYEEQEKQAAIAQSMMSEEDPADDDSEESDDSPPAESKSQEDEKEKLKKGEIKSKDIVDKLNTIRSGKSFKDSAIASKMDEYIESLSKPEKVALLAFLKGLSQIVTGEVEADQAQDPSDNPAAVKMEKGNEPQKKTIKPNVIKAPAKEKVEKKTGAEDTSGPVPITPKKK
jgi:hypothetical protein